MYFRLPSDFVTLTLYMTIDEKFLSAYDGQKTEAHQYQRWEASGFFNPDTCIAAGITDPKAEPFSMVLPPPNETGILHVGHASMIAIQDIMARFARMQGRPTVWIPGTDHAAIATESKVTKELSKKKINKREIGREKFLEHVAEFTADSRGTIVEQTKSMGASLDWSRLAYTLDDNRHTAVNEAFATMYNDGLLYRGHRIVNWDVKGQTVISDDEIVRKEETCKFYYFKYGPFTIGTARPETKFADKYVIVHPDDKRYAEYEHGQTFEIDWIGDEKITATLLKDEAADMEKGSGAMTITPWHSQIDFELAEKYDLEKVQIIDQYGKLLPIAGEFAGMKIAAAREQIVEALDAKGLLVEVDDDYVHQLATAERTGGVIEPQIMEQWFIDTDKPFTVKSDGLEGLSKGSETTMKEAMLHVVRSGQIKIVPERFEKVYFNWIENLRPWNISRQIWFGHRIPAWYKDGEIHVGEKPTGDGWTQDEDTLDTWFSSGLWTFSTLGWPEETDDLKKYHPTTILETGYDIIFFWVARMILMSTYLLGEIPFKTVYLHGLVRDGKGQKISKSLGNNIDPVELAEKFGTDALRMALIVGVGPGADNSLSDDKVKAYKKFANKLWNISRFVLENTEDTDWSATYTYSESQQKHIDTLQALINEITEDLAQYRLYLAGEKLYHYIWHTFADEILEESKENLDGATQHFLMHILTTSLRLLHPFMPFITEEIWVSLPQAVRDQELLMVAQWPSTEQ